jgi:hypothetical protein
MVIGQDNLIRTQGRVSFPRPAPPGGDKASAIILKYSLGKISMKKMNLWNFSNR